MSNTSLAAFNVERAHLLVKTLVDQGIRHFCIAPGSRSTPLALAIGEYPDIETIVHFDERGVGFYALGLAKAISKPVAVLVTTGTAAANLFPAVMEAHLSRTPLVIISADRPPELRDCGSNQTADHVKIFGSFIRWEIDLAFSDPLASDEYIMSSLSHAVARSMETPAGPVHVNCMIREPFIHLEKIPEKESSSCIYEPSRHCPPLSSFKLWGELLSQQKRGVILLGSDALTSSDIEPFLELAEKLNWPIFSDIISGGRQIGDHPCHIEHFEMILKAFPDAQVDCILHIGNRFVSKTLLQWISRQKDLSYFLVTDHPMRQDPLHKVSRKMLCSSNLFCRSLFEWIEPSLTDCRSFWKDASKDAKKALKEHFAINKELSEPALFAFLNDVIPSYPIYLPSSMPVRDADMLFYPEDGSDLIFCNRGGSGIDGNLATAAGIAKGLQRPLIAILGDLAALHDLSSFPLLHQSTVPIICIIINNQGGAIFSFLPVAQKKELFETFIATSHPYSFESIAKGFSLPFFGVDSWDSWEDAWNEASKLGKNCVIECRTNRTLNVVHHETIYNKVQCSFTKPLEALH